MNLSLTHRRGRWIVAAAIACSLTVVRTADAYVGPGAGFAFLTSFLLLFSTIVLATLSLLAWPFRTGWRFLRRKPRGPALIDRLIIVGFDGQDPVLTDEYLREGALPNFAKLRESGCYHRLRTTFPAVSPVAWSSFSTGTQPGKHNIFDFLDRDPRTYLPTLSSTHVGKVHRYLKMGKYQIPLQKPELRLLRKSRPFWALLGDYGIWSTVLRVPITFPPEPFHGAVLSAMCVPDLLGTQGTFSLYTTRKPAARRGEGGIRVRVDLVGDDIETVVRGPDNVLVAGAPPLEIPMTISLDRAAQRVDVRVNGTCVPLVPGRLSGWVRLKFRAAPGVHVHGISRFLVTEMDRDFSLYMSPINIDPERPAMPISHPHFYATYLAKEIGPYATLGLAEDTWALNERVIDEGIFLQNAQDIDAERQAMFFVSLQQLRTGVLACVFDATDRIQHMFWRYLEPHRSGGNGAAAPHADAIKELYRSNDALVGKILHQLRPRDVLMVISDHGFSSFRRGVNLNSWLRAEGYLNLREGTDGSSEWLRDVDWSTTRAYCLGLTGMFLNIKGREAQGIVAPGVDTDALKAEIAAKLERFPDPETREVAITRVFDTGRLYTGPYVANAPDLLIGYNAGYRAAWTGATGVVAGPLFQDNSKPWSGDHCIDPALVPGIFFCNRRIDISDPALVDIAPTALRLFGIEPPPYIDGKPLMASA